MKDIITDIKSHSPVVRTKSLHASLKFTKQLEQEIEIYKKQIFSLCRQVEDGAKENRCLRLEMQRKDEYEKWLSMHYPSRRVIDKQRLDSGHFIYKPLISIILPVYNTNPDYLRVCIESVLNQSYENWELCIVDDASTAQETKECLKIYANKDIRVQFKRLNSNSHISIASNSALKMAKGEFIALLDHDDFLWPNALYEVVHLLQDHKDADFIYSDEDKISDDINFKNFGPYFKPDWSPHLMSCINYIAHFSVLRRSIVEAVGGFDKNLVGAQDWDLFLRVSEKTDKIYHIPTILYSWRSHAQSTAMSIKAKDYATLAQERTLRNYFKRTLKHKVKVEQTSGGYWYPRYQIIDQPLVSIIIPTKDKVDYLKQCISSILSLTTYSNYEIIIVDTGSREQKTKSYYKNLRTISKDKLRIVHWKKLRFNYSEACNFGAQNSKGEYLLMLNNDTEIISGSWINDMVGYAQLTNVGAVGAKLLFRNATIQHAGATIGIGSLTNPVAGHPGYGMDYKGYDSLQSLYTNTVRNVTVVTGACLMVSAEKFWKVEGFDPKLRVTFNDVDLCLKLWRAGYLNVYLPFVELYHYESVSVGRVKVNRDMLEFNEAVLNIRKKWSGLFDTTDPYYNKNFYKLSVSFSIAVEGDDY